VSRSAWPGVSKAWFLGMLVVWSCSVPADETLRARALSFSPVPDLKPDSTNRLSEDLSAARFGQALFFEPGLSGQGQLSCASCHRPEASFADNVPVSPGNRAGQRNAPTLLDSAHERWFFRDGRADTLWSQGLQPLESSLEMAGSRTGTVRFLLTRPDFREAYAEVFDDTLASFDGVPLPVHARPVLGEAGHPHALAWETLDPALRQQIDQVFANLGKALAAYERKLLSGPSPFDLWVAGERDAISVSALRGFELFVGSAGCTRCHSGPRFTDGEFHNLGVPPRDGGSPRDSARFEGARKVRVDPFGSTGIHSDDPQGARSLATRTLRVSGEDWGAFKTPSLRNVARTAPYMHAGQFATLPEVLRYYSTLEGAMTGGHHAEQTLQPADLTDRQINDLIAFLESLTTADPPADLLGPPASH